MKNDMRYEKEKRLQKLDAFALNRILIILNEYPKVL